MTARDVLDQVLAAGHTLTLQDGLIRVEPPCSDEMADRIVRRRNGLMRLLGDVDRPSPMLEALDEYRERLTSGDQKARYVWTGYRDLDYLTGGTGPGYYTIVAARPKMGKSAFGLQWARYVAQHHGHVLFFTFEMDLLELAARTVCQATSAASDYHTPALVARAMEEQPRIWLYDGGRRLEDVVRRIRAFRVRHQDQAAAVFIDQVGHVRAGMKERNDALLVINSRLKEVAMEERLPVIGLHQINRGVEARPDKRPTLADLKDSGSFEEYSNQVLLLYRDGYYRKGSADDRIEVTVAANRAGRCGSTELIWHASSVRLEEPGG